MKFQFTEEQLAWCRKVSRRDSDFPYDRDDLYSAAMEAVWIASESGGSNQEALRASIFAKSKVDLWDKANAAKRNSGKAVSAFGRFPVVDMYAVNPMLVAMGGDLHRSKFKDLAEPCVVCGTKTGRVRDGENSHKVGKPSRTKGMCRSCYLKAFKAKKRKDVG